MKRARVAAGHALEKVIERAPALGFEAIEGRGALDALHQERAKIYAEFAPRAERPLRAPERQGQRTHGARAARAAGVGVVEAQSMVLADRGAHDAEGVREALGGNVMLGREHRRGLHALAQRRRKHGFDLGERAGGSVAELLVAPRAHHAQAEGEGFDFVCVEHDRWDIEASAERVADARLAAHRDAREDERLDVAVDRAFADLERFGDVLRGQLAALAAAEELDDAKESVGASHEGFERTRVAVAA